MIMIITRQFINVNYCITTVKSDIYLKKNTILYQELYNTKFNADYYKQGIAYIILVIAIKSTQRFLLTLYYL